MCYPNLDSTVFIFGEKLMMVKIATSSDNQFLSLNKVEIDSTIKEQAKYLKDQQVDYT